MLDVSSTVSYALSPYIVLFLAFQRQIKWSINNGQSPAIPANLKQKHHATLPALRVIGRSQRADDVTFNNGRLHLRHRRSMQLELFARCDPSQLVFENLLFIPRVLLTLFQLLFVRVSLTM